MSKQPTLNDIELADALSRVPEEFKGSSVEFKDLSFHVFTLIDNACERKITQDVVNISLQAYLDKMANS